MTGNIPYVDRLRQQLLDAEGRQPAPARVSWMTMRAGRLLVAVLLLVGVAVPLFALRGLGSRSAPQTGSGASSGNPPITRQLVVTTTKLQPGILPLTVAFGDVWGVRVGDANSIPPAGLIRLDGTTGAVKATIPINTVNRLEEHAAVTAAGGLIWVSEGRGDGPQTISAVDPRTNGVVGTVSVPGPIEGLAAADGNLWASIVSSGSGGTLVEIDPASDRVVNTVTVAEAGSLSVAGNSLWIHSNEYGGTSLQVNLATDAPGMKLEGTIGDVMFAGGLYWSIFTDWSSPDAATIRAIDPATGKTVATLPAPRAVDLAVSSAGLWVSSAPGYLPGSSIDPNVPATVSLIDPATQTLVAGPVLMNNGGPGLAAGEDALWFADYETGDVTKVTLQP